LRFSFGYALAGVIWFAASSQLHGLLGFGADADSTFDILLEAVFVGATALLIYFQLDRSAADELKWEEPAPSHPEPRPSFLVVVIILLSICAIGVTLYLAVKKQLAVGATSNLESISRLKVGQIESWLDEARSDTSQTIDTHSFKAELKTWLENEQHDDRFHEYLQTRLTELVGLGRFRNASLFDQNGKLLLTTANPMDLQIDSKKIRDAAGQKTTVLDDFHINEARGAKDVSLGLFMPIRIEAGAQLLAVLHVELNPERFLYPLLQQWPGNSASAETLLVRRDGNDIVFLNTLRHRNDAPLSLRLPIDAPNLLSAKSLRGQTGAISGVDYRKQSALAYSIPVPGTSWHLLSKIDEEEVDATLNSIAKFAAAMIAIQLLAAGLWVSNYYRAMNARNRAQAERLLLSNRIQVLVKNANDCIIILDENDRIIDVNDRCSSTYGYSREEMLGMMCDQLLSDGTDSPSPSSPGVEINADRHLYVTKHRRKDGSVFPVEISRVAMNVEGVFRTQKIIRDISERELSNARIVRLSQLYATLSSVNQAIARSKDIKSVFHTACSACVEHGGLLYAWISLADPTGEFLTVSHSYGEPIEHFEGTHFNTRENSVESRGPTGTSFREQRVYACNDYANDPATTASWRIAAARYGIRSSIALPISRNGVTVATLTAYSSKTNFFDAMVEHLLKEIADGLSFAMHHFMEENAKRKVEKDLHRSEDRLHEAQEIARIGHWQYNLQSGGAYWSPQMYRLFERNPLLGPANVQDVDRYYAPESALRLNRGIKKAIVSGERVELELEVRLPQEHVVHHATVLTPIRDEHNKTILIRGTAQDITERKRYEQKLQHANQAILEFAKEVEDLYQNAPCGYHSLDAQGVFQRINETELKWLGYSRDELIGKKSLKDLLIPEHFQRFDETFPRLIEQGEINDLEMELISKEGRKLPVLVNATSISDKQGRFLMTRSTLYNMTERRKMETERLEYSKRLEELSRRLVSSQETGRRELSAALHDQTSPNLSAIEINLNVIARQLQAEKSPEMAAILDDTFALLHDTTMSIREICSELRPSLLDYAGLIPALEGYANQFSRRTGTKVQLHCNEMAVKLAPDKESMLFRIIQEAMTNCAKHSGATSINVTLNQSDESTVLTIRDNGVGFVPELLGKNGQRIGQGVLNMREISEFIGGRFRIESSLGKGTLISVEL